jgi:hypothetical protein
MTLRLDWIGFIWDLGIEKRAVTSRRSLRETIFRRSLRDTYSLLRNPIAFFDFSIWKGSPLLIWIFRAHLSARREELHCMVCCYMRVEVLAYSAGEGKSPQNHQILPNTHSHTYDNALSRFFPIFTDQFLKQWILYKNCHTRTSKIPFFAIAISPPFHLQRIPKK